MTRITKDWLAEYEADARRRRERLPVAKRLILAALKRARVAHVEVAYDGEGDSGQIGEITAKDRNDKPAALTGSVLLNLEGRRRRYRLTEALDAFAWEALWLHHDGFENNEGGFGTIDIDVLKGTVTIDHNDRIVEVCNSVTEV